MKENYLTMHQHNGESSGKKFHKALAEAQARGTPIQEAEPDIDKITDYINTKTRFSVKNVQYDGVELVLKAGVE